MNLAVSFCRSPFARFINTPAGRVARIAGGLALIGWGWTRMPTMAGVLWMAGGLVPLVAGAFDLCLISPMLGGPVTGRRVRGIAAGR